MTRVPPPFGQRVGGWNVLNALRDARLAMQEPSNPSPDPKPEAEGRPVVVVRLDTFDHHAPISITLLPAGPGIRRGAGIAMTQTEALALIAHLSVALSAHASGECVGAWSAPVSTCGERSVLFSAMHKVATEALG